MGNTIVIIIGGGFIGFILAQIGFHSGVWIYERIETAIQRRRDKKEGVVFGPVDYVAFKHPWE